MISLCCVLVLALRRLLFFSFFLLQNSPAPHHCACRWPPLSVPNALFDLDYFQYNILLEPVQSSEDGAGAGEGQGSSWGPARFYTFHGTTCQSLGLGALYYMSVYCLRARLAVVLGVASTPCLPACRGGPGDPQQTHP